MMMMMLICYFKTYLEKLMSKKSKLENKKEKLVNQLGEMNILVKNLQWWKIKEN